VFTVLRIQGIRNRIKRNFETENAISVEMSISNAGRGSSGDYITPDSCVRYHLYA